jgi:hypothetical protein
MDRELPFENSAQRGSDLGVVERRQGFTLVEHRYGHTESGQRLGKLKPQRAGANHADRARQILELE